MDAGVQLVAQKAGLFWWDWTGLVSRAEPRQQVWRRHAAGDGRVFFHPEATKTTRLVHEREMTRHNGRKSGAAAAPLQSSSDSSSPHLQAQISSVVSPIPSANLCFNRLDVQTPEHVFNLPFAGSLAIINCGLTRKLDDTWRFVFPSSSPSAAVQQ